MGAPYALSSDLVSAWPAKSLEVAQYIDGQLPLIAMTQNAQTGTTYTLAATDFTKLVTLSNASPVTVTVPLQSSVAWVAGTQLRLTNLGAGAVTIAGAVGVTVNGAKTFSQSQSATLIRTASDTWTVILSGPGKILQVVQAAKTDTFSTTSTSFVDITGLSVSITPSSTSSRIMVVGMLNIAATEGVYAGHPRLVRDSTAIFVGDAAGSRTQALTQFEAPAGASYPIAANYVDSPASISALTYKFQLRTNNGANAAYVNRSVTDTDNAAFARGTSSIIVMEVSA